MTNYSACVVYTKTIIHPGVGENARSENTITFVFTCEDIGVAMVTNMISQLQESFPPRRVVFYVEISSVSIN